MRTRAVAAALAALAVLIAVPAAHARAPLGNKWRVTSVDISGAYVAEIEEDSSAMQISTETIFEGKRPGKPFVLRLSDRRPKVLTAPVNYRGGTEATFTYQGVAHNCDYEIDAPKHKLVGIMWLTPNGLRVQWNLVPVPHDCPDDIHPSPPPLPDLPTRSMVTKVPVRKLTGRTAVLPIRVRWKGTQLGWSQEFDWTGKVRIVRGPRK
jgi:hypothetical protein